VGEEEDSRSVNKTGEKKEFSTLQKNNIHATKKDAYREGAGVFRIIRREAIARGKG